jgi:hypothetical protein
MQGKAVRFLRDAVDDPDKAEEFEAMSPEEYAQHKRIEIRNPFPAPNPHDRRRQPMARESYRELKDRIAELEEENQSLTDIGGSSYATRLLLPHPDSHSTFANIARRSLGDCER